MPITAPPTITALPTPPDPNDRSTFNSRAYPWSVAQQTFGTELTAVANNVYNNALDAKDQAGIATTKASEASASAALAKDWATKTDAEVVAGQGFGAKKYAGDAALSAAAAAASALEAAGLVEKYLGALSADPTLDKNGNPLTAGDWYINTTTGFVRVYNGSAWVQGISVVAGVSSLNGLTGDLTGFVTEAGAQSLTNKTLTDPKLLLGGTNGTTGQVPVSQGAGLPPVWGSVEIIGSGGATASGSVTLTAASPAMQSITTTGHGQSVTLPDATTLPEGVTVFGIYNAGEYDLAIKNAAGAIKGFLRPFTSCFVGLSDNSTVAGVWAISGSQLFGVSARYDASTTFADSGNTLVAVPLDADRTVVLFGGTTVYAIAHNKATNTWGTAVAVRTGIQGGRFAAIKCATDSVLVTTFASTPQLAAIVLSVSGTTITVNTAATASPSSNGGSGINLIQVGSSFIVGYAHGTPAGQIHAITISGTTPTIGASVNTNTGPTATPLLVALTATTFVAVYNNASGVYAKAYSVSGSTLTGGNEDSITGISSFTLHRVALMPSGSVAVAYTKSSATFWVRLLTISGTTTSATEVQVASENMAIANFDWSVCGTNKLAVVFANNAGVPIANVLTDTSGTISLGTQVVIPRGSTSGCDTFCALSFGVNPARFFIASTTSGDGGAMMVVSVDANGASPVVSVVSRAKRSSGSGGVSLALPSRSGMLTGLGAGTLSNGSLCVSTPQAMDQLSASLVVGSQISATNFPASVIGSTTARGANNREAWAILNAGDGLQLWGMAE